VHDGGAWVQGHSSCETGYTGCRGQTGRVRYIHTRLVQHCNHAVPPANAGVANSRFSLQRLRSPLLRPVVSIGLGPPSKRLGGLVDRVARCTLELWRRGRPRPVTQAPQPAAGHGSAGRPAHSRTHTSAAGPAAHACACARARACLQLPASPGFAMAGSLSGPGIHYPVPTHSRRATHRQNWPSCCSAPSAASRRAHAEVGTSTCRASSAAKPWSSGRRGGGGGESGGHSGRVGASRGRRRRGAG
jgi:hypothetical protein